MLLFLNEYGFVRLVFGQLLSLLFYLYSLASLILMMFFLPSVDYSIALLRIEDAVVFVYFGCFGERGIRYV